jgi:hypothetical protein
MVRGQEIVIEATNDIIARRAFAILQNAGALIDGADIRQIFGQELQLSRDGESPRTHRRRSPQRDDQNVLSHSGIPIQCLVSVKVASKLRYRYALAQLSLSYRLISISPYDLDPTRNHNIPKSPYEDVHISFAHAIIAAYAVIEQLGLEVRANPKMPSTVNGRWNPPVLADLETRLSSAGIDLTETFHWSVRGGRTRLERDRPAKILRKSPWCRWQVRDGQVRVVDAIAHISWLRSRVSAHGIRPASVRVLSIYDVTNAQCLARRLLLESLSCWRTLDQYP